MFSEKKELINSLIFPSVFIVIIWLIEFIDVFFEVNLHQFGIFPLKTKGLSGILFSPLIHEDWKHLFANTIPLFILLSVLFNFYKEIAIKILLFIYLTTNIWVWIAARDAWHIGASGIIYGLISYIFVSGIIRKNNQLMALSLFVVFLYGGLIWGIFPNTYPQEISWESHLYGMISGVLYAFYFKNEGPQNKQYFLEEDEITEDEDPYWLNDNSNENK